jgi:hypothetical protein
MAGMSMPLFWSANNLRFDIPIGEPPLPLGEGWGEGLWSIVRPHPLTRIAPERERWTGFAPPPESRIPCPRP